MFPVKRSDPPPLDLETFSRSLRQACRKVLGELPDDLAGSVSSGILSSVSSGTATVSREAHLSGTTLSHLYAHYLELRRWNRRLSLIGPGTLEEVLERHYAESLAGLLLLPPPRSEDAASEGSLVDLGSGAGFPGWILGAVRPDLATVLVEARERKGVFLQSATRKARARSPETALPIRVLNARVGIPLPGELPEQIDAITTRALKLEPLWLEALSRRLTPAGRILLWLGEEVPPLPRGLVPAREIALTGSERRRILEVATSR